MNLTLWVIAASIILLSAFDMLMAVYQGSDATISWQISTLSKRYPIVPFVFGVLMGHFFTQMR